MAQQLRRAVPGGIGTYVRGLAQGLVALSPPACSVELYAGRPPRRVSAADPLAELGLALRSSRLPARALTALWGLGAADLPAGFDVVHTASLDTPPSRRQPMTVAVHDLAWRDVPQTFPPRGRRWHEAALGRALSRAAAFVVPCRPVADALVGAGAQAGTVHVIPYGADHLPPPDDAAATDLLERAGVNGEFLLTVGTLEPRKNLVRLVEAYRRARPSMEVPLPLVVVGPTGWSGEGPGDDGSAFAAPGVVAAGPAGPATLAGLYRRARLLAFVPLLEGFGLPPLEAMAIGTPVLASPVPSTGGAALEVDPLDVGAIADGIVRLASDAELRRQLTDAGTARARSLTWLQSARRHLALWESLV